MEKILEFLKNNPVFYVATVDGDRPRTRPFGFHMEFEGKLYFSMLRQKPSYKQLLANPNVEICTCSPDNVWVRISGQAVFDERECVMEKIYEIAPETKDKYNEETGLTLANFYIKNGLAEFTGIDGYHEEISF